MVKIKEKLEDIKEVSVNAGDEFGLDIEEMAQAGLNFGHRVSRRHPKMEPYISGMKNTVDIINLEKTVEEFTKALKFIQELISEKKIILFVGTKIQIKDLIKETAKEVGLPYVSERWLGGTFTNLGTILKRIEYLKELERKKAEGELEKYTKKERIKMEKELTEIQEKFEGIRELTKLPDAIFIADLRKEKTAVREARRKGIKIIAIVHTNVDPTLADYPIPANDDAISSVKYILEKVAEVIKKSRTIEKTKE